MLHAWYKVLQVLTDPCVDVFWIPSNRFIVRSFWLLADMLHVSQPILSDTDSDFDDQDPDDVSHLSILGPSASKGELLDIWYNLPSSVFTDYY